MILKIIKTDLNRFGGFLVSAIFICGFMSIHANAFAQSFRMSYDNGMISLSAKKVDIKAILLSLSKETNIFIRFPAALKKEITIKLSKVSVRKALRRLLRDQDYAIIYSGSRKENSSISKVYVVSKQWGNRKPASSHFRNLQVENVLRNYTRRLHSLRSRLRNVNRGSPTEKLILRQIETIERTVERLKSN